MDLDKETQQQLLKAEKLRAIVSHPNWGEIKKELLDEVDQLNSLASLNPSLTATALQKQVQIHREIVRILYNWIGKVETQARLLPPIPESENFIVTRE